MSDRVDACRSPALRATHEFLGANPACPPGHASESQTATGTLSSHHETWSPSVDNIADTRIRRRQIFGEAGETRTKYIASRFHGGRLFATVPSSCRIPTPSLLVSTLGNLARLNATVREQMPNRQSQTQTDAQSSSWPGKHQKAMPSRLPHSQSSLASVICWPFEPGHRAALY